MNNKFKRINNLKEIINKTEDKFGNNIAYKIKIEPEKYKLITHKEARDMVNALGTALIDMGLKDKKIAIIGENRYEWEIAYLSIVCGTGIVVPLDKSLTENELRSIIDRSGVEAIFYAEKYEESLNKIKNLGIGKLKHLISMDLQIHGKGIYSEKELIEKGKKLIEKGDRQFLDAKIDEEKTSIMLFTSGTTSASKIVALSHKNICSDLTAISNILDVNSSDIFLSFLPLHHVFECTVGFLFAFYTGAQIVFCDGIRHIVENLYEYNVSVMISVPAIYERIFKSIRKQIEKKGNLEKIQKDMEEHKDETIEEKKNVFKEIHDTLGGNLKLMISGAASLDVNIEQKYRKLGFNLIKGYGLTETSPVVAIETNENYKLGSVGKAIPGIEVALSDKDDSGMGELIVKGPIVMKEYYKNEEATNDAIRDGWFYTGDLAKIDDEGYVFICGRKKSVIVLKNGKNIFPEEMENLLNKIEGIEESFVYGKRMSEEDENDIKINAKLVYNEEICKNVYKVESEEEIKKAILEKVKDINKMMPRYKSVRGISLSKEALIKTSTGKIKRQMNLEVINKEIVC